MFVKHFYLVFFERENEFPSSFTFTSDLTQAVVSCDLERVVGTFGDKITVMDTKSQKATSTIQAPGNINDLALSPDAILAVTNRDLLFVSSNFGAKEFKLPDEGTAVVSAGGFVFIGTKRGSLLKVEQATGKVLSTVQIGSSKITKLEAGQQGKLLGVGCSNGLLAIYSIAEDRLVSEDLKYHNMPITAIAFYNDDSRCLTAAHERDVHVWDLTSMKHVDVHEQIHRFSVNCLAPCPGGFYSAGHDGSLKRWTISN